MEADEVGPSMTAYAKLRKACNIDANQACLGGRYKTVIGP